jgi:hypothetical protein
MQFRRRLAWRPGRLDAVQPSANIGVREKSGCDHPHPTLQRAADAGGLKLTATGNLSRAVVAEIIEVIEWPNLDKTELFRFNKLINEPDFLPAYFVRMLLQAKAAAEEPR